MQNCGVLLQCSYVQMHMRMKAQGTLGNRGWYIGSTIVWDVVVCLPWSSEMWLSVSLAPLRSSSLSSHPAIFCQVIAVRWHIQLQLSHVYSRQEMKKEDYQLEKLPVQFSLSRPHPLHPWPRIEANCRAGLSFRGGVFASSHSHSVRPQHCKEKTGKGNGGTIILNSKHIATSY